MQDTLPVNDAIFRASDDAAKHFNELAEMGGWEEGFAQCVEKLSNEALGQLLLQFPLTESPVDTEGRPNRQLALEVADIIGPDHAQALYRFAVLVTKLA